MGNILEYKERNEDAMSTVSVVGDIEEICTGQKLSMNMRMALF